MTSMLTRNAHRILAVTMCVSGLTGAAFAEPPTKVKGNGGYLAASGYDTSGCIWSYVYAGRGGTTAAPQTWMNYDVYDVCAGQWPASGWGIIPNTALKIGNKTATLVFTPSASANFSAQGETGPIQIKVTADGLFSYSYSGHTRSEYAGHVYQSHGSWTERSATVTGTVVGFAQGGMRGSLGEGRDRYMEFDRGSN